MLKPNDGKYIWTRKWRMNLSRRMENIFEPEYGEYIWFRESSGEYA